MEARSGLAERLLVGVESVFGSGEFRVDERLCVEEVRQRGDQAVSTARISVRLDDDFDSEEARRRYRPDLRLAIMTDGADVNERRMLFEGYPPVQSIAGTGGSGMRTRVTSSRQNTSSSGLAMMPRRRSMGGGCVRGPSRTAWPPTPQSFAGQSALMTALPCVFNPDGVPNQAAAPMTAQGAGSTARPVHLFTWDNARAVKWTYATALRYLIWFTCPGRGRCSRAMCSR